MYDSNIDVEQNFTQTKDRYDSLTSSTRVKCASSIQASTFN